MRETPEQYANIVLPYIRAIPPGTAVHVCVCVCGGACACVCPSRECSHCVRFATCAERNAWIENIFAKTSASDKAFFESEHFVLMNDAKWDGQNIRQLHCLGS